MRTQQIIAYESGVTATTDPLGGSFFIESLTDEMEKAARTLMDKIDAMGGAVKAIEAGFMQEEIARSAYAYNTAIEDNSKIVVGVNSFTADEHTDTPVFRIDDSIRITQCEKLQMLRQQRDATKAAASLTAIKKAALDGTNLMPVVIEAVENLCTLGEISDVLRGVWGEYAG